MLNNEEEPKSMRPELNNPDEYSMEDLEQITIEEKILLAREEIGYLPVSELTPGEIAGVVRRVLMKNMKELHPLTDEEMETVAEVCTEVAYEVMNKMAED